MKHGSLFSGIGGFDLAASWMGWENVFHCEWNQFGQQVLKYHFPNSVSYDDICKTDFTLWRGKVDIITGGFPCQPYSMAGKRKGTEDSRHLWPEMLRAIRECRPSWIVGENVPGLINWSGGLVFEQVCAELEGEGYEVQPVVLPASGVNAPHRRDRVWFVAYRNAEQREYAEGRLQPEPFKLSTTNSNNARGSERSGIDGIGSEENERRNGQPQPEYWKDGNHESTTNTESTGSTRRSKRKETTHSINGGTGENWDAAYTKGEGLQRRGIRYGFADTIHSERKRTDWTDFPTVSPLRTVHDGVSGIMVRNIKSEVYGKISENYAAEDLQKVWDCFQSEEVREQIRGLYKIHGEGVLLQTLQLCQSPNIGQGEFSPFGEDASKGLLRKLSKHGEFGRSPQGLELEKQFAGQFGNTLPHLSHEIALAAKEIEKECIKFASWHRNESIKAAGNAIVPQVAFQIFKVIDEMNKQL
jgi:DNA (cytosine-5)-methyltransferase 1